MFWCRTKKTLEVSFPQHNMVLVLLFQLLVNSAFFLLAPSLYKFITTPKTRPEELQCSENGTMFWPGLGRSDADYALVLVSYPLFEVVTAPLSGALLHCLPFSVSIAAFTSVYITGGVVYSMARSLWMAFVGFGLFGMGSSLCSIMVHTYLGEMGTLMDDIRKKRGKRPRKYVLYIAFSFVVNGGFLFPLTINSVMAQFNVNPYHWPGWMLAALTAAVAVCAFFFFVETRSFSRARPSCKTVSCLVGLKLEAQLQSKCKSLVSYLFLCGCGFLGGMMYTIYGALVPPVLSDQFGFTVEYTSHFLLVMASAFVISSFFQLGAKCAQVDNRKILCLGILFAVAGSLLCGDWQAAVDTDACLTASNTTQNPTPQVDNVGAENETDRLCLGEVNSTNSSLFLQELAESCERLSQPDDTCFWNRQSRVTNSYCYTCLGVCLSLQRSLNIYQLSMGVVLLCFSASLLFVFSSAIVSDIASVKSQGKVISLVIGFGALARATSPFGYIKSYEMTGRHTYFSMGITAGYAFFLFLCLAVMYKNLAPRDRSLVVNATSKFSSDDIVDEEPAGVFGLAYTAKEVEVNDIKKQNDAA